MFTQILLHIPLHKSKAIVCTIEEQTDIKTHRQKGMHQQEMERKTTDRETCSTCCKRPRGRPNGARNPTRTIFLNTLESSNNQDATDENKPKPRIYAIGTIAKRLDPKQIQTSITQM